jgi:integrase
MASAWIVTRPTKDGGKRYRVLYRLGNHDTPTCYGGSFKSKREALLRKAWVAGELAAMRVPDLGALVNGAATRVATVAEAAERWLASRIDIAESTKTRHGLELARIRKLIGGRPVDALAPAEVADFVAALVREGYSRGTIRKTLQTLAMALDHAGVSPNPARDKQVRLPREEEEEISPPTAAHVEAVYGRLPRMHRLALLFLDWSGARVGAIDHTLVSDYDEPRRRVRLRRSTTKMRRPLWIELHPALDEAIKATLPHRRFRDPEARLFVDSGADALRTAIAKACKAEGIPPHGRHLHARPERRDRGRLRAAAWLDALPTLGDAGPTLPTLDSLPILRSGHPGHSGTERAYPWAYLGA